MHRGALGPTRHLGATAPTCPAWSRSQHDWPCWWIRKGTLGADPNTRRLTKCLSIPSPVLSLHPRNGLIGGLPPSSATPDPPIPAPFDIREQSWLPCD